MNIKNKKMINKSLLSIMLLSIIFLIVFKINFLVSAPPIMTINPGVTFTGIGAGSVTTSINLFPSSIKIVDQYVQINDLTTKLPVLYFSPNVSRTIMFTSISGYKLAYMTFAPTVMNLYSPILGVPTSVIGGSYVIVGSTIDITSGTNATVTMSWAPPATVEDSAGLFLMGIVAGFLFFALLVLLLSDK
jgi:hypothetical protein